MENCHKANQNQNLNWNSKKYKRCMMVKWQYVSKSPCKQHQIHLPQACCLDENLLWLYLAHYKSIM